MRLYFFKHHKWLGPIAGAALLASTAFAQTSTLSLSSGAVPSAGPAILSLSIASQAGSEPAAVQWTLAYPASSVTSVAVTAGPALIAADKTVTCNAGSGSYTCLATGLNANIIANGVLANIAVTLAFGVSNVSIQVNGGSEASSDGDSCGVSTAGGSVSGATPVTVTSVTCGNNSLSSGMTTTCAVNLSSAVLNSTTVALTSSSASLTAPSSVTVPMSATSASFTLTAGSFTSDQSATVTASLNGSSQTASVALTAPVIISSFQCAATTLSANMSTTCSVALSKAAGTGGALISLSSNSTAISIPSSMTIPAGASSISFNVSDVLSVSQNTMVSLSALLGTQSVATTITLSGSATVTSIWSPSAIPTTPWMKSGGPGLTVGLKFRSDISGYINGVRFYKGTGNNGSHIGLLYSSAGALLAQGTFTGESASGWQQVNFTQPVAIAANTVYVVALYSDSGCASDAGYFISKGIDNAPLHALQSGVNGGNGVYTSGKKPAFPSSSTNATNYWVDVAFTAATPAPTPTPTPVPTTSSLWSPSATPVVGWVATAGALTVGVKFRSDIDGTVTGARFYKGVGSGSGTHIGLLYSTTGTLLAKATFTGETASGWQQVNFSTPVAATANTTYIIALYSDSGVAYDAGYFTGKGVDNGTLHAPQCTSSSGNGVYSYGTAPVFPSQSINDANYWVDVVFSSATVAAATSATTATATNTVSVWGSFDRPATAWVPTAGPIVVGMKFRADVDGSISAVRFYKGAGSTGNHIGLLYSANGSLLAQATFSGETASGWQQVSFSSPVAITANTTYIVALYTEGGCAYDSGYFTNTGVDHAPIHALQSGVNGGNGVYTYATAPAFPALSLNDANYWVDLVFTY